MEQPAATRPLAGLKVIDMTRVIAGPFGGQIHGDLGADVIKIERRREGDDCRRVGPPWIREPSEDVPGESTYFQAVNRNKRSLSVDFGKEEGQEILRRIVADADILAENYRTRTLARNGDRVANWPALKAAMREALKGRSRAEWVQILNAATVSAGSINEIEDMAQDEHVIARNLFFTMASKEFGEVRMVASPYRFSASPVNYRIAPPALGEHTDEVLHEAGLSAEECLTLRQRGVI